VIAAVLFDLDDTLFDHAHCARTALDVIRGSHSCFTAIDLDELNRSHSTILEALHGDVAIGRVSLDNARAERFRRLFRIAGVEADDGLSAGTASAYRQAYLDARRAVDGAAALLDALHGRARIAIVTNNLVAEQREKLRHCGLDRYVDVLMASEEAGVSKPDPQIFRLALERLGCEADAAVMVGDSWPNDIVGAQAAGIRAIWFNPAGDAPLDPSVPVLRALVPVEAALRVIGVGVRS
jgi:YjjG family noncanonical pyrimidine nucleotidase